jgi:hypothetical protein
LIEQALARARPGSTILRQNLDFALKFQDTAALGADAAGIID